MENRLDFAQWAESPKENFSIAQVPMWIAALLKMENAGESYAALLSPQTFAKNRNHHPDVAIADYLRIDRMLNKALFVTSFRKTHTGDIARKKRHSVPHKK